MDYVLILFKIFVTIILVGVSLYSALYFTQISKIEKQFGLKLPSFVKKILAALTMVPMVISLIVLVLVLTEIVMR